MLQNGQCFGTMIFFLKNENSILSNMKKILEFSYTSDETRLIHVFYSLVTNFISLKSIFHYLFKITGARAVAQAWGICLACINLG